MRGASIRFKLGVLIGLLIADLAVVIAAGGVGMEILSGLRAYVGGEGLWAKAQKNAVVSLVRYASTREPRDYADFEAQLAVPLGDRRAREALQKAPRDEAAAREGFLAGGNSAEDLDALIAVFRRFAGTPYFRRSLAIWTEGDERIEELRETGARLRGQVAARAPAREVAETLGRVAEQNARLTVLENEFSASLGEGSRWARRVLLSATLAGSALIGGLSVWIALLIVGGIDSDARALADAAARARGGDLSARAPVNSEDELGRLSEAFNAMVAALEAKTRELERSNADLEQFAFTASHDLQEPLRKVIGFAGILRRRLDGAEPSTRELAERVESAAGQMSELIRALLLYARLGRGEAGLQPTASRECAERAAANLEVAIRECGAAVELGDLPAVRADASQLVMVFQNLIGNAVKFRGARAPRVRVDAARRGPLWEFRVSDNGIGFDPRHSERVFALFERLHGRSEYPGNGIGLAVCKKIVERHGGRIRAESMPGEGSAFVFTWPALEPGARA